MTPAALAALASSAYGPNWQSPLAREMSVGLRTVQRWARDGIARPATAAAVRRFIEERRTTALPAPPDDPAADRTAAARAAVAPSVLATAAAAEAAGWPRDEACEAIAAVAAHERHRS
jgi:hypothetical protein